MTEKTNKKTTLINSIAVIHRRKTKVLKKERKKK